MDFYTGFTAPPNDPVGGEGSGCPCQCTPPGGAPGVPGTPGPACSATQLAPLDPNDLSGPAGFGPQHFVVAGQTFPYLIDFENKATANAPAQVVTVTQQLSANLDWTTFQLGAFGFGGQTFPIPAGLSNYSTRLDERATLGIFVDVSAIFNTLTGQLVWTFTSIDPATGDLPANILTGFLPPDKTDPQGAGFISYTVQPKAGSPTGTVVSAKATVIFDDTLPDQSSLDTPTFVNTIDTTLPTSAVLALPAVTNTTSFNLRWAASDQGGSGVAGVTVYVSDNGGPFTPFVANSTASSAVFTGVFGHTYAFYSVATSNIGAVQPTPSAPQAATALVLPPVVTVTSVQDVLNKNRQVTEVIITFSGAVNIVEADNKGIYRLATPGKRGSYTAKNSGIIAL